MSRYFLYFLLLAGCSSHAVRCDSRLQPINAVTPVVKPVTR